MTITIQNEKFKLDCVRTISVKNDEIAAFGKCKVLKL